MLHGSDFLEIAAILGISSILAAIGQKLRQPLIIMFLAAGILAGPSALGIIDSYGNIELLAHIGIALLLFIVGLKLDIGLIRTVGTVALATGLGQIIFTSLIGFVIALAFGMNAIGSAYVAVALTFSSTIIIVKLLSDKKEIDSLHGQIAVGFLIVQDIAAILALVGLTTFGAELSGAASPVLKTLLILGKGAGFLAAVAALSWYVIPRLMRRLAQSQELLALFAVTWAVILGSAGEFLGFSKEVGAFLAGVSLASTNYRDAIGARLTGLRDFLLLFFFIDLGARLDWSAVGSQMEASAVFSVFVLVGNPLIVCAIMGVMGYRRRTGFLAGLTVAQISEFSLIVAALGLRLGHITQEIMGLITLVGVVTIFASTYLILYSGQLYEKLSGPLKIFEKKNPYREAAIDTVHRKQPFDVILVGLGNYGSGITEHLLKRNRTVLGVDFDPEALDRWRRRGLPVLYGDIADPEIHDQMPLAVSRWVVSTARVRELNLALLEQLRRRGYEGKIALTAVNAKEALLFENAGADVVLRPFSDAAEQAVDSLSHAMDILPGNIDWPISFKEFRIQTDSAFAGRTIRNIPIRALGVSILAVSRAGRINYEFGPDFQVYPGDRLVLMGSSDDLRRAEKLLSELKEDEGGGDEERFIIGEMKITEKSGIAGKTLEEIKLRQKYGVTVVGIRRENRRIEAPGASERVMNGDCLIVIGGMKAVENLKQSELFCS